MTENELNNKEVESETPETEAKETPKEPEAEAPEVEESTSAEEALEEASEAEKPETDPKDAVIGDFRKKLRESELMTANLRGQIEAAKPKPKEEVAEVSKSPFDLAADEAEAQVKLDGGKAEDAEVIFSPKLLREQAAFEKQQREQQSAATTREQSNAASSAAFGVAGETMNVEAMGEGLDFNTIITEAGELVTEADMKWLASKSKDYPDFYKRLYEFSTEAITKAGGAQAADLQTRIKAHSQAKTTEKEPEKKVVATRKEIIAKAKTAMTIQDAQVQNIK